jgi:integrase
MGVYQERRKKTDGKEKAYWRVDFTYRHPDGRRERVKDLSPINNKRGAEEHERQLRAALQAGTYQKGPVEPPAPPLTLRGFLSQYLAYAETHLKASTLDDKKNRIDRDVLPMFGDKPLISFGVAEKDRMAAALKKRGLAPTSINNSLGALGSMLRYAEELKLIVSAPPCRFVRVLPTSFDFLDFDEYEHLVATSEKSDWYAAVILGGEAGLRLGEIRALRWCDVDLRLNKITVRKALWRSELDAPKGGRERVIPLTQRLGRALQARRHMKGDWVFCGDDKNHLSETTFDLALGRLVKRAQIRPIGFRVLRHTFCSHLAMKGATAKAIQELAGHQDLSTTQRYMHLSPSHLREAIGLLDARPTNAQKEEGVSK